MEIKKSEWTKRADERHHIGSKNEIETSIDVGIHRIADALEALYRKIPDPNALNETADPGCPDCAEEHHHHEC